MTRRGGSRSVLALASATVVPLVASAVHAEPPLDLEWSAPASCPDRERVIEAVEAALRRDAPLAGAPVRARGAIERTGDGWSLRLTVEGDPARAPRTLEDASCEELARSAALILALAIDPGARTSARTNDETLEARASHPDAAVAARPATRPATPAPSAGPDRAPVEAPHLHERRSLRWSASASALVDVAALPAAAPGVGAGVGLSFGRVGVDASASYLFAEDGYASDGRAGATLSLATGGLRACYAALRSAVDLSACVRIEMGAMWGEGFGVLAPGSASALWVAPGPGILARLPVAGPLSVQLGLDALVPLARERFVVVGAGEIHRAPPMTGRGALGLELAYP